MGTDNAAIAHVAVLLERASISLTAKKKKTSGRVARNK
jgi:hypothetical protein